MAVGPFVDSVSLSRGMPLSHRQQPTAAKSVSCKSVPAVDVDSSSFRLYARWRLRQSDSAAFHFWYFRDTLISQADSVLVGVPMDSVYQVVLVSMQVLSEQPNCVFNGDFELRDTGFACESRFQYQPSPHPSALLNEGTYAVDTNPSQYRYYIYPDTTYDGRMLMVHSLPKDTQGQFVDSIFAASCTVDPASWYLASYEAAPLASPHNGRISTALYLDDSLCGAQFPLSTNQFEWRRASWLWNSGTRTSVDFRIGNPNNCTDEAHQLAVDNVQLRRLCVARDTMLFCVRDSFYVDTVHIETCMGDSIRFGKQWIIADTAKLHYDYTDSLEFMTAHYADTLRGGVDTFEWWFLRQEHHLLLTVWLPTDTTFSDVVLRFSELFSDTLFSEDSAFLAERPWFKENFPNQASVADSIVIDTTIILKGLNYHGCDSVIHYRLVLPWNCDGFLQFPSVVTPNGDGINDVFAIKNLVKDPNHCRCYENNVLSIYNRWGKRVYHKENILREEDFWDPDAVNAPDGTYFFYFAGRSFYDRRTDTFRYVVRRSGSFEIMRMPPGDESK